MWRGLLPSQWGLSSCKRLLLLGGPAAAQGPALKAGRLVGATICGCAGTANAKGPLLSPGPGRRNHDAEADLDRRGIVALDAGQHPNATLTRQGPPGTAGASNYYLDIYDPQGTAVAARIWCASGASEHPMPSPPPSPTRAGEPSGELRCSASRAGWLTGIGRRPNAMGTLAVQRGPHRRPVALHCAGAALRSQTQHSTPDACTAALHYAEC